MNRDPLCYFVMDFSDEDENDQATPPLPRACFIEAGGTVEEPVKIYPATPRFVPAKVTIVVQPPPASGIRLQ